MHHSVVHMKRRKLLLPKSVQTIPHSLEKSKTTPCPMECQLLMLCVCLLVITVPMTSHILEQQAATNYEAI